MSRKLDVSLNQMFDYICGLPEDLSAEDIEGRKALAAMVGNYTDDEIYTYLNRRAKSVALSTDDVAVILSTLDSFRDYIEYLES